MKQFFSFLVNHHSRISRYLAVVASIIIISSLFPRSVFNYDFERSKPWRYENLYAPFTFPILKSEVAVSEEREKIKSSFTPYYRLDENAEESKIEAFAITVAEQFALLRADTLVAERQKDSLKYIETGGILLEMVYAKGIFDLDESHRNSENSYDALFVLDKNVRQLRPLSDMYDLRAAFAFIVEEVSLNNYLNPDFLLPILRDHIAPNVNFDLNSTEKFLTEKLDEVSLTQGVVQQGEAIIAQGAIINEDRFQKLVSLKAAFETTSGLRDQGFGKTIGYLIITSIIMFILLVFINLFEPIIVSNFRRLSFILLIIITFLLITKLFVGFNTNLLLYCLPYCVIPIVLRTLFSNRLALVVYVIILLLSFFILPLSFEFLFLQFAVGLIAILTNTKTYYWSQFFTSVAYIFFTYCLCYLGLTLIQSGSLYDVDWNIFGALLVNSLITLLAYPLVPVFERFFGVVSSLTLIELGDLNKPLLKQLSEVAPGTFWHSLQVASLAEAAARELGVNSLLVKTGALYHDIGKMENPTYFVENQTNNFNPHDELPPEESAEIIVQHVQKGISLANAHRIPNAVINFIRTHHGTTRIGYFYQMFIKQNPDKEADVRDFQYGGPTPFDKETAIVMMADSVEAASLSLKNPTNQDIENLVERIINDKIDQNQFVNSSISFKDIHTIKKIFKKLLKSKFQTRVAYPFQKK